MTQRTLDLGSWLVVVITFVLFVAALFLQGMSHNILLEAAVFLVSLKLIIMAYKNSVANARFEESFNRLHATLARLETRVSVPAETASAQK